MINPYKYIDELATISTGMDSLPDLASQLKYADAIKKLFEKAYYEGWSDALIEKDKQNII